MRATVRVVDHLSTMLPAIHDYDELCRAFRWQVPERYNIGVDVCDRWADAEPSRLAIVHARPDGATHEISYGWLRENSNRFANALRARGIGRRDRVAILLPQVPEAVVAHVAAYKLGAIALPLAILFGTEALTYRLKNSGARAVVTDASAMAKLASIRERLPDLALIVSTDGPDDAAAGFHQLLDQASSAFDAEQTSPDDPAMMIYTSGTTGPPKGALHAHRVLLGHLPGVEIPHEFFPHRGDRFWTPSDWAWAGGLLDVLLPSLHFGVPVVARRFDKFDPEAALALMRETGVRNAFIAPTALRMLRSAAGGAGHGVKLRTLGSGGEALGSEMLEWGRSAFAVTINEFYGQTECNLVLASCRLLGVSRAGSMGKPVPGHQVAVIRPDGSPAAADELGQIAVKRPDPVMFLEYWGRAQATQEKFVDDWMITGDQGFVDADGYFHFIGRDDDVITSAGHRIGPGEIEDCLIRHPAVALAAAVGKPDPLRTEIVKAFIVLKPGESPSDALAAEIRDFVKTRLAAHEYPREIEFIDAMPMTTTGKIIRKDLRERG
jgi:acetyl-CoA synthetase